MRRTVMLTRLAFLIFACVPLAVSTVARAAPPGSQPSREQVLAWLEALKPLPKVHYSWPLPPRMFNPRDPLFYEYVRITHAVTLHGEVATREQVEAAVAVCRRVNAAKPSIPASLAVKYSPWHHVFGKQLPPTDQGRTHRDELDSLQRRLKSIAQWVELTNLRYKSNIAVSAVLFDCERFHVRPGDVAWNAAITQKYDAAYELARRFFPNVRVEWYDRGAVHRAASGNGWKTSSYFTLAERGDAFACSLYTLPEIGYVREIFRKTVELAETHGVTDVTPWIALGSGYQRRVTKFHEWTLDWDYDLIYSWLIGREANHPWFGWPEQRERFAPWNAAKIIVFYPEPFGRSPAWGKHFVAYVRGAHMIKELPK